MDVMKEVKSIEKDIIKWRRQLHEIPEYDFKLYKTSEFVKNKLQEMNIEYKTLAETGIVAILKGGGPGKTIALRADMDALPIKEETELPFASDNGFMHACGHDAHTAMLLGVAKIFSKNKNVLNGNVKLIFQPAEETTGGAKVMIDEGCMDNPKVDAILGLHIGRLFEDVGNGQIGYRYGGMMAAADSFSVKVIGKGGHGAMPHLCIDPVVIASEIIISLQKILSREISPTHPAVITIGMIHGGRYVNIIPQEVEFSGTVRTINSEDRVYIEKRIKKICANVSEANKAKIEVDYRNYYPAVLNNEKITEKLIESAEKVIGKENVVEVKEPILGAEDMSYYLQKAPGTFFGLGSYKSNKDGQIYPHHHPKFDIDESTLWIGSAAFVQTVLDFLNQV